MSPIQRLAAAGLLMLLSAGAAHASLVGKSFSASYRFPRLDVVYPQSSFSPSPFTAGVAGVDTTGNVEDVTFLLVDFEANRLTIEFDTTLSAPTWSRNPFNGPRFDLTKASDTLGITKASVNKETTMRDFDATRIFFDDQTIALNWQDLSYVDGTRVVVDFTFAEVPEPSTWLMLAGGLAALGLGMRRRRA